MTCLCYATPQDHDLMRGFMKDCSPTLSAAAGHSGNNRPFFFSTTNEVRYRDRQRILDSDTRLRDTSVRGREQTIKTELRNL